MVSTRLLTIPILAALMAGVAGAQASDAEIAGLITDPSGAPIAGAGVTLVNQDSGFTRNSTADPEGRYRFVALAPGRYSIKVEAAGFKTANVSDLVLTIGTHVDRDINLTIGNVQEVVTVTGEVPPIDTTKGDVSGVVTAQQIDTLPVNTGNTSTSRC